jgi:hypothetical protein
MGSGTRGRSDRKDLNFIRTLGAKLFPVDVGKKTPLISGWPEAATSELNQLKSWERKFPGCGWGVACGPSGWVVVDIDGVHGEVSVLDRDLPATLEVETQSGNRHLIYSGRCASKIEALKKVDIKAVGGYVVAAGSPGYRIVNKLALAAVPDWARELAGKPQRERRETAVLSEDDPADLERAQRWLDNSAPASIQGEGGNDNAYRIAARIKDFGVSEARCLDLMLGPWNERCEPPWDFIELSRVVENVYHYGRGDQGAASAAEEFDDDLPACDAPRLDPDLVEFNQRYCVVGDTRGLLIFELERDPETSFPKWRDWTERAFIGWHQNRIKRIPDSRGKNIGKWWLEHPARTSAQSVIFNPDLAPGLVQINGRSYLNLWHGWAVEPMPGDWSLIREELIAELICSGDEASFEYVMDWMARMVQLPGTPGETALVLRGDKGVGKSTLGQLLYDIAGAHAMKVSSSEGLTGSFSGHLMNRVFLFADEAFWAGDKKGEGKLKDLVTGKEIPIRAMYKEAEMRKNRLHILMASNSDWVVPATVDERRFAVFHVSNARRDDALFWNRIYAQARSGGLQAMLYDLLARDIRLFRPQEVPITDALGDQKELGLGIEGEWIIERLESAVVPEHEVVGENTDYDAGPVQFDKDLLYDDYMAFARARGLRRPTLKMPLGKFLARIGVESVQLRTADNRGKRVWSIDLYRVRDQVERLVGKKLFIEDLLS